ncbi:hypothetical protein B7494_g3475 [Chlorociboria aeruginascens]|nr:hypothetical protein B7494_g3475 [Chlorociboria aeruginascens]
MNLSPDYLLPAYIAGETLRANYAYYVFSITSQVSPSLVVCISEGLKFLLAFVFLFYSEDRLNSLWEKIENGKPLEILQYAIPAALYLANNLIYFNVLPFTSPELLQLFVLTKFPATAVLHHFWIRKQSNVYVWSALSALCVGLLIFNSPSRDISNGWLIAVVAGVAMACSSALANIFTETLTKSASFWESQFWLYTWGVILSISSYPLATVMGGVRADHQPSTVSENSISSSIILSILTAAVGMNVAGLLRKRDSLTKLVGTLLSFITIAISQFLFFPELHGPTPGWTVLGGCVILVSTAYYDVYKDGEEVPPYILLQSEEGSKGQSPSRASSPKALLSYAMSKFKTNGFSHGRQPRTLKSALVASLLALKPSFIKSTRDIGLASPRKQHPTSYLDGMRGIAALWVMGYHISLDWFPEALRPWDGRTQPWIVQLPWLRLLIDGRAMVAVFFVVSGFSISYKPLKLIRNNDIVGYSDAVTSFIFRRYLRLFLPILIVSFFIMLIAHLRLVGEGFGSDVPLMPLISDQFLDWWYEFRRFASPFKAVGIKHLWDDTFPYDRNLWTIPYEFRGSMIIYLVIISTANFSSFVRLVVIGSLAAYTLYIYAWDLFIFLSGTALAEIHLILARKSSRSPRPNLEPYKHLFSKHSSSFWAKCRPIVMKVFWFANFLFATFLLGMPDMELNGSSPGYTTLWSWTPSQYLNLDYDIYRFWQAVGAVYLVAVIDQAKFLQPLFTNSVSQYFGKISYAFYMVHGTVLKTWGWNMGQKIMNLTGRDTEWGYAIGGALIYFSSLVLVVWIADVVTRFVDEQCVWFGKWLYDALCNGKK